MYERTNEYMKQTQDDGSILLLLSELGSDAFFIRQ